MSTANYSLTTRVTDTFTAPRWVHYGVKVLTGAVALLAYMVGLALLLRVPIVSARLIVAASLCSWSLFMVGRVKYFLDHRHDNNPMYVASGAGWFDRVDGLVKPDLWCDMALHCTAIGAALWVGGMNVAAFVVALVCLLAFHFSYPWSSP